jgi:hypothetical protein
MTASLPSHAELMAAQEQLSRARDKENEAGNDGLAQALNGIVIGLFKIALSDECADELAAVYSDERDRLCAAVDAALALHQPAPGSGQGFLADGQYGDIDPACQTCGTWDEYAVPYPCATVRALAPVADPDPHTTSDKETT